MEVHLTAETEKKLKDLAAQSGRGTDDLVENAMTGYFEEALQTRATLTDRYDDFKSRRANLIRPLGAEESLEGREFCGFRYVAILGVPYFNSRTPSPLGQRARFRSTE